MRRALWLAANVASFPSSASCARVMGRVVFFLLLALLAPCYGDVGLAANSPRMPNVIFVLADDIGETKNVAIEHPEVVREMAALLDRVRQQDRSRP